MNHLNLLPMVRLWAAGLVALLSSSSFGQFVAFNDHDAGPGTHANTTTYTADPAAGSSSGFLRNIATGATLPVGLAVSASFVTYEGTQGNPNPGTPLYASFHGYVDFEGLPNPSIALNGTGGSYIYTFSGLDPTKRYSFRGGAIRNGGYVDRWTLCEITGAASFTSAHTVNALTGGQVASLTPSQAAFNFDPPASGDMADWEDIDPGSDGIFSVSCSQYLGIVPGGSSGGAKGYGMTGIRLEELTPVPEPAPLLMLIVGVISFIAFYRRRRTCG